MSAFDGLNIGGSGDEPDDAPASEPTGDELSAEQRRLQGLFERNLNRALNDASDILNNPNASDFDRNRAQSILRAATGDPRRDLNILDALAIPSSVIAGVAGEIIDVTGVSPLGVAAEADGSFDLDQILQGSGLQRDELGNRSVTTGFGEVTQRLFGDAGNELGFEIPLPGTDATLPVNVNTVSGFLLDLTLDPLNLIGGASVKLSGRSAVALRELAESGGQLQLRGLRRIRDAADPTGFSFVRINPSRQQIIEAAVDNLDVAIRSGRPVDEIDTIRDALQTLNLSGGHRRLNRAQRQAIGYRDGYSVRGLIPGGRILRTPDGLTFSGLRRATNVRFLQPGAAGQRVRSSLARRGLAVGGNRNAGADLVESGQLSPEQQSAVLDAEVTARNVRAQVLSNLQQNFSRLVANDPERLGQQFRGRRDRRRVATELAGDDQSFIEAIEQGTPGVERAGVEATSLREFYDVAEEIAKANGIDFIPVDQYVNRVRRDIETVQTARGAAGTLTEISDNITQGRKLTPGEEFFGEVLLDAGGGTVPRAQIEDIVRRNIDAFPEGEDLVSFYVNDPVRLAGLYMNQLANRAGATARDLVLGEAGVALVVPSFLPGDKALFAMTRGRGGGAILSADYSQAVEVGVRQKRNSEPLLEGAIVWTDDAPPVRFDATVNLDPSLRAELQSALVTQRRVLDTLAGVDIPATSPLRSKLNRWQELGRGRMDRAGAALSSGEITAAGAFNAVRPALDLPFSRRELLEMSTFAETAEQAGDLYRAAAYAYDSPLHWMDRVPTLRDFDAIDDGSSVLFRSHRAMAMVGTDGKIPNVNGLSQYLAPMQRQLDRADQLLEIAGDDLDWLNATVSVHPTVLAEAPPSELVSEWARYAEVAPDEATKLSWDTAMNAAELAQEVIESDPILSQVMMNLAGESAFRALLQSRGALVSDANFQRVVRSIVENPVARDNLRRQLMSDLRTFQPLGDNVIVNEDVARFIDRVSSPAEFGRVLRAANNMTSFFKAQATLSPGFTVRNAYSALFIESLVGHTRQDLRVWMRESEKARVAMRSEFDAGPNAEETVRLWGEVDDSVREHLQRIYRSGVLEGSTRLDDAIFQTASEITNESVEVGVRSQSGLLRRATRAIGGVGETLDNNVGDRLIRAFATTRRQNAVAGRVGSEHHVRGMHLLAEMRRGASFEAARRSMFRHHFDYGDLTKLDSQIKVAIPFWTFRSRNLPLQMEMIARRPGAYSKMVAWQNRLEGNQDPYAPSWYDTVLRFNLPGNLVFTPDTGFNDLLDTMHSFSEIGSMQFGIMPIQLDDDFDQGVFRLVLNDAAPLFKLPTELLYARRLNNGAPIDGRIPAPILGNNRVMELPGVPSVISLPLRAIQELAPGLASQHADGTWYVQERVLYALEQTAPLFGRTRRLAGEEEQFSERRTASWLSFLGIGARQVTQRERVNRSYEMADDVRAVLERLEELGYAE